MDFIVSLVSLLLVFGAGGRGSANFALAVAVTPSRAPMEYWHTMLPETPLPSAIHDLLIQSTEMNGATFGGYGQPTNVKGSSYGSENSDDYLKEVSVPYGLENSNDLKGVAVSYGQESSNKGHKKVLVSYGPESSKDLKEVAVSYGSSGEDDQDDIWFKREEDQHKVSISVPQYKKKVTKDEYQQKLSRKIAASKGRGRRHDEHVHSHGHPNKTLADVFFLHDAVRLGSVITPTIPPTTSLPALLPRCVADTIPFSTDRLATILAMFEPTSLAIAGEIRWALDLCEHPRPLPGDEAACATSLESLAEIPAALLGTCDDVRAFSGDMPIDRAGTPPRRGRYNVTAVRTLSEPSSKKRVVTCHDLTYPYAVFYCHTASSLAAYAVTLAAVDDAKEEDAPATMEVLTVCHLDTSQWNPKNPFFELHNLRPGEVTVCHFLSKLSIIWVPAGEQQGGTRVA